MNHQQKVVTKKKMCTNLKKRALDQAMLDFVIKDLRPFNFCSSEAFKNLFKLVESTNYDPPSRRKLVSLLNAKYNKYMREVRKKVNARKTSVNGSLTTDLWSSSASDAYMGTTFHYIDDEWNIKSKALTVRHLPKERHTADVIAKELKKVKLNNYLLPSCKTFCLRVFPLDNRRVWTRSCKYYSRQRS